MVKTTDSKIIGEDVEKLESTYTAGEYIKWCDHFEKQLIAQKIENRVTR